jgi:hypothetical protein
LAHKLAPFALCIGFFLIHVSVKGQHLFKVHSLKSCWSLFDPWGIIVKTSRWWVDQKHFQEFVAGFEGAYIFLFTVEAHSCIRQGCNQLLCHILKTSIGEGSKGWVDQRGFQGLLAWVWRSMSFPLHSRGPFMLQTRVKLLRIPNH